MKNQQLSHWNNKTYYNAGTISAHLLPCASVFTWKVSPSCIHEPNRAKLRQRLVIILLLFDSMSSALAHNSNHQPTSYQSINSSNCDISASKNINLVRRYARNVIINRKRNDRKLMAGMKQHLKCINWYLTTPTNACYVKRECEIGGGGFVSEPIRLWKRQSLTDFRLRIFLFALMLLLSTLMRLSIALWCNHLLVHLFCIYWNCYVDLGSRG